MKQKKPRAKLTPEERLDKLCSETPLFTLEEEWEQDESILPRLLRLQKTLAFFNTPIHINPNDMLGLVLYDITDNRIRKYISLYLERKGFVRVQYSVFFGNVPKAIFEEVTQKLHTVNSLYKNGDSIMLLPIATDTMQQLQLIGKSINFTAMVNKPHTLVI